MKKKKVIIEKKWNSRTVIVRDILFNYVLTITVTCERLSTFRKWSKRYPKFFEDINDPTDRVCGTFYYVEDYPGLYFILIEGEDFNLRVLSHELNHACFRILKDRRIQSAGNDELHCYLHEYLLHKTVLKLNKKGSVII